MFCFERDGRTHGVPAGRQLTDHQGVIAAAGTSIDAVALLRAAGLDDWRFDHVPSTQRCFSSWTTSVSVSPVMDLTGGFERYESVTHAARVEPRKARRLEREIGPLRFEPDCHEPAVLDALLRWKSAQYRATGVPDLFATPWCDEVARRLPTTSSAHFAGMVSALWAGDQLIAAHLGLRSGPIWHWWIPAYDGSLARYSPGTLLLLEMAKSAEGLGVTMIDLGKGDERYKDRMANGCIELAKGTVTAGGPARAVRRLTGAAARRLGPKPVRPDAPGATPDGRCGGAGGD